MWSSQDSTNLDRLAPALLRYGALSTSLSGHDPINAAISLLAPTLHDRTAGIRLEVSDTPQRAG